MKIVITQEDVKNAGSYDDNYNCPLAKVMQKILNNDRIGVGSNIIGSPVDNKYATIHPPFLEENYNALKNGEIKEFVTEYTPL